MINDIMYVFVVICGNESGYDTGAVEVFTDPTDAHEHGELQVESGRYDYFMIVKRLIKKCLQNNDSL